MTSRQPLSKSVIREAIAFIDLHVEALRESHTIHTHTGSAWDGLDVMREYEKAQRLLKKLRAAA